MSSSRKRLVESLGSAVSLIFGLTGLGRQLRLEKSLTPRSYSGQDLSGDDLVRLFFVTRSRTLVVQSMGMILLLWERTKS